MILSHRHRFVFIKGLKVAGTSVEIALSQLCGPDDIITPITPLDERLRAGTIGEPRNYSQDRESERAYISAVARTTGDRLGEIGLPRGIYNNHMPLSELLALNPEAAEYRVLFTERSPYEKVLSLCNWRAHRRQYEEGRGLPRQVPSMIALVDAAIEDGTILKARNIDRYRDKNGAIGSPGWRFETLAEDVAEFIHSCGAAAAPLVHAKRGLEGSRESAASLLRKDQIDFINREFADEFAAFGYPRLG